MHNPQEEASLKVSAFVLPGTLRGGDAGSAGGAEAESADEASGISGWSGAAIDARDARRKALFPNLCQAFSSEIESFGPNDFFVLQKALKEDAPTPTLKAVVRILLT